MNNHLFSKFLNSKVHFSGGQVVSKLFIIISVSLISFYSSAASKPQKQPVDLRVAKMQNAQNHLKIAYEANRTSYYKKSLQDVGTAQFLNVCRGQSNIECQTTKLSQKTSFKYKRLVQDTKSTWTSIKEWISSFWASLKRGWSLFSRSTKMNKNNLPTGGDILYNHSTSGVNGKYTFSTLDMVEDTDGEVISVTWDFDDGSSMNIPKEELDNHVSTSHIFPGAGTYDVTLKIYDNEGEYLELTKEITVTTNEIPTPDFTAAPDTGNIIDFAAVANDPENSIESYSWFFGDGSSDSGPTMDTISHEFPAPGEYEVSLLVRDTGGGEVWRTKKVYVDIAVPGTAQPYAIVKMNTAFGEGPLTVAFDGSLSVNHAGSAVTSYDWDFGDLDSIDNTSTDANPTHTYNRPGTYYGRLRVLDASDNAGEFYFSVFVSSPSTIEPFIMAEQYENNRNIIFNQNLATRVGLAEWDGHFWDFGDNVQERGASLSHNYAVNGAYPVRLVVHDLRGVRHVVHKTISVTNEKDEWDIKLHAESLSQEVSAAYSYSVSHSPEPSNDIEYNWVMGDGTIISGSEFQEIQHGYSERGIKPIFVIVTNESGISLSKSAMVAVQDGSQVKAKASIAPVIGLTPLNLSLDAGGSESPGATIEKYVWLFSDGTRTTTETASKTFSEKGHHWVRLYVKSSEGNEDLLSRKIVVYDPVDEPSENLTPKALFTTRFDTSDPHIVTLDANEASDDDEIISYTWSVGGTVIGDGQVITHEFPEGLHAVTLLVTDAWNRKSKITKNFRIKDDLNPTLNISLDTAYPSENVSVSFNAASSVVPGVDIQGYVWDFGDGSPIQTGESVQHTYAANGTYIVKLTIKDIEGTKHQQTFEVIVDDPVDPTAVISVADLSETDIIGNGGTFVGLHYPTTFKFSALNSVGQRPIVDAIWDFGDGNMGYGLTPEFTIFKPGTYEVTVTVFDTLGRSASQSANIILDSETDCISEIDDTLCLRLETADQNVLKFSENQWRFSNSSGLSFATSPTGEWVKLFYEDETNEITTEIDVSDIVTIDDEDLLLSKSGIVSKGIDLSRPYQLVVDTESTTSETMHGRSQKFFFGSGSVNFKTEKENVDLVIMHVNSNFKKYIRMASSLNVTIDYLPLGSMILSAQSGTDNSIEELKVNAVRNVVKIDFAKKSNSKSSQKLKRLPDGKLDLTPLGPSYASSLAWTKNNKTGYLPEYRGCNGELPPLPPNPNPMGPLFMPPADWILRASVNTDNIAEINFTPLPEESSRRLKLVCQNASDSHDYAWSNWYTSTCGGGLDEWWAEVKAMMYWKQSEAIKIIYQVKDSKSGTVVGDSISTTPQKIRDEMGYTMQNMGWKVGVPSHVAYMKREIDIPSYFVKPEFKIKVIAPNYIGNDMGFAGTWCDLYSRDSEYEVTMTAPASSSRSIARAERNAKNSLDANSKFFPVQVDANNATKSALLADPTLILAKYKFEIKSKDTTHIEWEKVKMTWELPGHLPIIHEEPLVDVVTELDPITGKSIVYGYAVISPEMFKPSGDPSGATSLFNYKRMNEPLLTLKYEVIAEGGAPVAVGTDKTFRPLYNARTSRNNKDEAGIADEKVCTDIYGDNLSLYGTWELITQMKSLTSLGLLLVCNDMSLPYGGLFHLTGASKPAHTGEGHQNGTAADIRYFNTSVSAANDYDQFVMGVQPREEDVSEYIEFSKRAYAISQGSEYPIGSVSPATIITSTQSLDRRANLYSFCYSGVSTTAPCSSIANIPDPTQASELSHAHILDICQRFQEEDFYGDVDATLALAGCPFRLHNGKTTLQRLKRLGIWLEQYEDKLNLSLSLGSMFYYISSGEKPMKDNVIALEKDFNWQQQLIERGMWPMVHGYQELVRKYDDNTDRLVNEVVALCYEPLPDNSNTCGLEFTPHKSSGRIREGNSIHYHHQHLQLMEK